MEKPYLRDVRAAAVQQQKEAGEWLIAGVDSHVPWPKAAQVVEFGGLDFILRPGDENVMPSIVLNASRYRLSLQQAQDKVLQLASAFAWSAGQKLAVSSWLSGNRPLGVGKWKGNIVQDFISSEALPSPADPSAWVALALFREGVSITNPFYSFLSFYKAISAIHRDGKAREQYFDSALPVIDDEQARTRIDELSGSGLAVGKYLYEEGRNAIAHAEKEVFVNPDSMVDYARIQRDLPVIRALAEYAIQERYGIDRHTSNLAYPPSSISGIEAVLGAELAGRLSNSQQVDNEQEVAFPETVSIVARRGADTEAYLDMGVTALAQVERGIRLLLADAKATVQFSVEIDLASRKMLFDPLRDMGRVFDDDSAEGIEREIKFLQFRWCMFCNGRLELWSEESNKLLSRGDAFIACNMMPNPKTHEEVIAKLNERKDALIKSSRPP